MSNHSYGAIFAALIEEQQREDARPKHWDAVAFDRRAKAMPTPELENLTDQITEAAGWREQGDNPCP